MKVYAIGCFVQYNSEPEIICILENLFQEMDHGYVAPIYAWSRKKSLAEKFIETHRKEYLSMRVLHFDTEEEFNNFEKFNRVLKIDYIEYSASILHSVNVLSTEWERRAVRGTMFDSSENYVYDTLTVDYTIFKQKYIDALDFISYTTLYDIFIGGDDQFIDSDHDIECRQEVASHNSSYNVTVFGNKLALLTESEFFHYSKLFISFINQDKIDELIY